uniref:Uncharacterized protein n=1 Tax=Oryza glumipatula TaxID=40148 RepID=A0A0E0B8Q0_9ORYZ
MPLGGWIRRRDKAAASAGDKPNAEVMKVLWARKNKKMRRCKPRQQHDQLRRGDPLTDVAKEEMQRLWRWDFKFFVIVLIFVMLECLGE